MTKINDVNAIKETFIRALDSDEGDAIDALNVAVRALKAVGLSKFMACTMATHWAVEQGLIDPEDEDEAEKQAEKAVAA